jgi:arylsulfatase
MACTFDAASRDAPSRRRTRLGNRAIHHDGWMASTTPPAPTWDTQSPKPADVLNGNAWKLCNLVEDPTRMNDLAAREPAKLPVRRPRWPVPGAGRDHERRVSRRECHFRAGPRHALMAA